MTFITTNIASIAMMWLFVIVGGWASSPVYPPIVTVSEVREPVPAPPLSVHVRSPPTSTTRPLFIMVNEMRMQEDPQDVRNGNGGRRQVGGNGVGAVSGAAQPIPIPDDDFALEGYAR